MTMVYLGFRDLGFRVILCVVKALISRARTCWGVSQVSTLGNFSLNDGSSGRSLRSQLLPAW